MKYILNLLVMFIIKNNYKCTICEIHCAAVGDIYNYEYL